MAVGERSFLVFIECHLVYGVDFDNLIFRKFVNNQEPTKANGVAHIRVVNIKPIVAD